MKRLINILIGLCLAVASSAQTTYKGTLDTVPADGYYVILLPADLMGVAMPNLIDLRIFNSEGVETAYTIRSDGYYAPGKFIDYTFRIDHAKKQTYVWIDTEKQPISSFTLRVKNAETEKQGTLLGSNDKKQWFTVKEQLLFYNNSEESRTEKYYTIHFPLSDYAYYQLIIDDSLCAPLNILGVGNIEGGSVQSSYIDIRPSDMKITSDKEETNICLVFDYPYSFSELQFYIASGPIYKREILVREPEKKEFYAPERKRHRLRSPSLYEEGFSASTFDVLSSAASGRVLFPDNLFHSDTLFISITNNDDQPLAIDSIHGLLHRSVAIAYLHRGETYTLVCGNPHAKQPKYDMSIDEIMQDGLSQIEIIHSSVEHKEMVVTPPNPWLTFLNTYGIWVIIIIVMAQILYIVWRILRKKEMDK